MAVKFYTFFRAVVHSDGCKIRTLLNADNGTNGQLAVKLINSSNTLDLNKFTCADLAQQFLHIIISRKNLKHDRVGKIRDGKDNDGFLITNLPGIHRKNFTMNDNFTDRSIDLLDIHRFFFKVTSIDHIRIH